MMKLTLILIIGLLSNLFTQQIIAQSSISGVITEVATRRPLQDIDISLYKGNKFLRRIQTDSLGSYSLNNLTEGTFSINFDCFGINHATREVILKGTNHNILISLELEIKYIEVVVLEYKKPLFDPGQVNDHLPSCNRLVQKEVSTNIKQITIDPPSLKISLSYLPLIPLIEDNLVRTPFSFTGQAACENKPVILLSSNFQKTLNI